MPAVTRSVVIARPVPEVFTYMDDVDREHEWQPNLKTASQEPRGPVGAGTLKRYTSRFLGKEIHTEYRVTVYEMFVRTVYESTEASATRARAEIRWEPLPEGTRVTMTVDASPPQALRLVPGKALESASIRELEGMLDNLKACLEAG